MITPLDFLGSRACCSRNPSGCICSGKRSPFRPKGVDWKMLPGGRVKKKGSLKGSLRNVLGGLKVSKPPKPAKEPPKLKKGSMPPLCPRPNLMTPVEKPSKKIKQITPEMPIKPSSLEVVTIFRSQRCCRGADILINEICCTCHSSFPSCRASSQSSLARLAPLEAVLFDVDGTLCDSDPLHYLAFREMLLEVVSFLSRKIGFNGGAPITEEFFIQTVAGKHNDDIAKALFPDDLQRGLKFVDDKEALFRRMAKEQLKPLNGLDKVRKWIESHGLKRAAVTNAPRANAELMISLLGLSDFFDAVIIGGECEHAKPHPDPYLKGLEALKASKDHTFVFEDSFSGIKAGVAAGMPVIGLATRNPENLLMEAKPTFLIKDYEDPKLWAALEELDKASSAPSV
ncbi:unnamed protein product [Sphenostylis stenocarpa]|uniref:Haloacid dehalogenase-like hydrolase domain-containing protein Sgpp n=1 Tax=Sphenostylis stenocarpa TaxID=92480 RepID=A0AA86RTV8_9FABA|nr:unnamed protein product [Sphenostylis stenocarpa]